MLWIESEEGRRIKCGKRVNSMGGEVREEKG